MNFKIFVSDSNNKGREPGAGERLCDRYPQNEQRPQETEKKNGRSVFDVINLNAFVIDGKLWQSRQCINHKEKLEE